MKTTIEKMKECYVVCSIDAVGKTVYLRMIHKDSSWEIVTDVEIATKCLDREAAEAMKNFYMNEIGDGEWAIVPLIIQYSLVEE